MRTLKFLLMAMLFVVLLGGLLIAAVIWGMAGIPGWGGKGTPDATPDRGTLIRVVTHGPFTIEQRRYEAGKDTSSTEFCDYWVTFNGKPFKLDQFDMVNQYNSCKALLLLEANEPTFVIGSYYDSNGGYLPVIVSTIKGVPNIDRREACVINSGGKGNEQSREGWHINDGHVSLCGRDWNVLPR
jgi:hypothetical protein